MPQRKFELEISFPTLQAMTFERTRLKITKFFEIILETNNQSIPSNNNLLRVAQQAANGVTEVSLQRL